MLLPELAFPEQMGHNEDNWPLRGLVARRPVLLCATEHRTGRLFYVKVLANRASSSGAESGELGGES
jgi:hypothetical protein